MTKVFDIVKIIMKGQFIMSNDLTNVSSSNQYRVEINEVTFMRLMLRSAVIKKNAMHQIVIYLKDNIVHLHSVLYVSINK